VRRARRLHCSELAWEVWRENERAYRFYERAGAEHRNDVSLMRFMVQP
jgi:RimJ/RimL family protein N-acetyltransferase